MQKQPADKANVRYRDYSEPKPEVGDLLLEAIGPRHGAVPWQPSRTKGHRPNQAVHLARPIHGVCIPQ